MYLKSNTSLRSLHFLIVLVLYTSCVVDKADNKLKLINSTAKDLFFILKADSLLVLEDVSYIDESTSFHKIGKSDTCFPLFALINEGGYVNKINKKCVDSTLLLFVFEIQDVRRYGWEKVIKNEQLFWRKGYKVHDLNKMDWTVDVKILVDSENE